MTYIDPPAKLLKHIDRVVPVLKGNPRVPPVNVEIDLSNRCSLGCAGCHFAHTHSRGPLARSPRPGGMSATGDIIDTHLIKRILDQLFTVRVRSIVWSGGGEPTLHPDFDEIIGYNPIPQGIYTNGGHIDEKRAWLMKKALTWIYISLDYPDRASYHKHKLTDAFDRVIRNVVRLKEAEGDATIGLGFLLWKENWRQTDAMIELGWDLDVDYIQFRPMVLYDFKEPGKLAENTEWMHQMISELELIKDVNKLVVDIDRFRNYANWQGHGYDTCWWSRLQTVITPDGRVWTCVNRRGMDGDCLGDLNEESFMNIWERHTAKMVDGGCRVMCRGHIPNTVLDNIARRPEGHELFI